MRWAYVPWAGVQGLVGSAGGPGWAAWLLARAHGPCWWGLVGGLVFFYSGVSGTFGGGPFFFFLQLSFPGGFFSCRSRFIVSVCVYG